MVINPKIYKIDVPFVVGSIAVEIAAILSGVHAGDIINTCDDRNGWHYIAWTLGITGVVAALAYIKLAVKQKWFGSIVAAILLTVTCAVMAVAAWFASVFCFTF